jgi:hypothetical protein
MAPFGRLPGPPQPHSGRGRGEGQGSAEIRRRHPASRGAQVRPVEPGGLDLHAHRPAAGPDGGSKAGADADGPHGDLLREEHVRVVGGLVALVGDEVEDFLDRAADEHLALDVCHVPVLDLRGAAAFRPHPGLRGSRGAGSQPWGPGGRSDTDLRHPGVHRGLTVDAPASPGRRAVDRCPDRRGASPRCWCSAQRKWPISSSWTL